MKLYKFKDIVGNTSTIGMIKRILSKEAYPKISYMRGQPGTGKTTTAEIVGMYLTCLSPKDGEPCLECTMCKRNIQALTSTGKSTNLVKYNMGKLNTRKDMLNIVEEVFTLTESSNNNVYILEELHTLKPDDQTMLLEEIDRMDRNCYIIICSTEDSKIIAPLKSRAIKFDFKRLMSKESAILVDRTAEMLSYTLTKEVRSLILEYTHGIPRDIVGITEFIINSDPSLEEIQDFLHYIPFSEFNDLFGSVLVSAREMSLQIERMLSLYTIEAVVSRLRKYATNVMLYLFGGEGQLLTKSEKTAVKKLFTKNTIIALNRELNSGAKFYDEESLTFLLFNISLIIKKESLSSVYSQNQVKASLQYQESKRDSSRVAEAISKKELRENTEEHILTSNSFSNFFEEK